MDEPTARAELDEATAALRAAQLRWQAAVKAWTNAAFPVDDEVPA